MKHQSGSARYTNTIVATSYGGISYLYPRIRRTWLIKLLKCNAERLENSTKRLRKYGYLLFGKSNNTLFFHINPRLAWKGEMSGALWINRNREFDASITNRVP